MCLVPCFHASRECVKKFNRHCGSGLGYGVVHVQALGGNSTMAVVTGCFTGTFFLRESQLPYCLAMAKKSDLRDYLEDHSLSSGQVFLSIQLKTFSKFSGWTFNFFFLLNCIIVYFVYL